LANEEKIPYLVIGAGSNLLVSDEGFRGLVIKMTSDNLEVNGEQIIAESGLPISKLVKETADKGLSGLEFLAGIPGTVGGAVVGNAGAWGESLGDKISQVEVLKEKGKAAWIDKDNCQFSYRDSVFKHKTWIVLRVKITLKKGSSQKIKTKIEENLNKKSNQPHEPSAGCIFVNPRPDIAAKLIEECGLKGKTAGGAKISEKHSNFIVNTGEAKAKDVCQLINEVKKSVKEKFGVDLQEEVRFIGKR